MNSERGRAKTTRPVLASPGRAVKTERKRGCPPRWIGPKRRAVSFGLYLRAEHPPTWKGPDSGAAWPQTEVTEPPKDIGSQEVGLRVKPGRESLAATERTSTGMP